MNDDLVKKTRRGLAFALTLLITASANAVTLGTGSVTIAPANSILFPDSALVFATSQKVGTESAAVNVTLTAGPGGNVNFSAIGIESPNFTLDGDTCGSGLTAGNSCTLPVKFTPVVAGKRYAELIIRSDATGANNGDGVFTVYLQGTAIGKTSQTISFGAAPTINVGGTGTVSATATSGLAVTYSSTTPSFCTLSGSTVTGVAAGPCAIAADQAGDANNYYPATQVTQNIAIGQASQTVTFTSAPATISVGGTGTVSATGGASGNPVTFTSTTPSYCSISGSTVTGVAAGTCTIAADQAGNANYAAAATKTQDITINTKTNQTIAFGTAPTVSVGGTGTVTATASPSGLAVTYSSTTTGVCTVSGSTVTGVAAGICTIAADQAGNATYNAAPQVTQSFAVSAVSGLCSQYGLTTNTELARVGNTSKTLPIKTTQGYSISFTTGNTGEIAQLRNDYASVTQYVTVSKNKCDYDASLAPRCAKQSTTPLIYYKVGGTSTYQCILEPNTTYYFNVRDATRSGTTNTATDFTNTCAGNCSFWTF